MWRGWEQSQKLRKRLGVARAWWPPRTASQTPVQTGHLLICFESLLQRVPKCQKTKLPIKRKGPNWQRPSSFSLNTKPTNFRWICGYACFLATGACSQYAAETACFTAAKPEHSWAPPRMHWQIKASSATAEAHGLPSPTDLQLHMETDIHCTPTAPQGQALSLPLTTSPLNPWEKPCGFLHSCTMVAECSWYSSTPTNKWKSSDKTSPLYNLHSDYLLRQE